MPNSAKKKITPIVEPNNSSSESELMIDEASPRKNGTSPQKRHRKRSRGGGGGGGSGEEQFEMEIEKTIKSCMRKDKVLTPDAVKRIIRKLILNEHVLAVVKLKEEELQKRAMDKGSEADDEDDEVVLKLTRSKAKELDQGLLPLVPLKTTDQPDSETLKLLNAADLHDDSDTDQSYKPDENEENDYEHNTTISDLDSLPTTPIVQRPEISPVRYTADGQFKIPRIRNESITTSEPEEEPIFKRTRTKLCYKTTNIEDLESTLIAPDITTDMYEMSHDMDQHWAEFLKEFTKPLNPNADDEDDNDPEFTPVEEGLDAEEMKHVAISKKEYNLLLRELSTMMDENQLCEAETLTVGSPEKEIERRLLSPRASRKRSNLREEETPGKHSDLNTPTPQQDSLFQPDLMSTMVDNTTDGDVGGSSSNVETVEPVIVPLNDVATLPIMTGTILIKTGEGVEPIKIDNVNLISGGNYENGMFMVPPFQEFLIRVPTEDLLKNSITNHASMSSTTTTNETTLLDDSKESLVDTIKSENVLRGPVGKSQPVRRYDSVINLDKPPQQNYSSTETKFLDEQLRILEQQLRICVQFCAQGFLQTYAHPVHWQHADRYEQSLQVFASNVSNSSNASCFNAVNLQPALELIDRWKSKRKYIDGEGDEVVIWFLTQQNKFTDKNRTFKVGLNPLIINEMLNSPAILYPQYLPTTSFKFRFAPQLRAPFTVGEESLISFGLEKFGSGESSAVKAKGKKSNVSLRDVCHKIAKHVLMETRTGNGLYGQVYQWISNSSPMNAVKYYQIHSKAPEFVHKILPFEGGHTLVERNVELPEMFRAHLTMNVAQKKTAKRTANISNTKSDDSTCLDESTGGGIKINLEVKIQPPLESSITEDFIDEEDIPLQYRIRKTPGKRTTKRHLKLSVTPVTLHNKKQAKDTLERLLITIQASYQASVVEKIKDNPILFNVFERLRAFDIYAEMSNTPTGIRKLYPDIVDDGKSAKKTKSDDNKPIVAAGGDSSNNKKKANDNLDRLASWNYLEKVEEVLVGANKPEEYEKFIETLKNFDPTTERVADLYYKMEKIFHPHHSELLIMFLTFLLPGQAMEVGKYFDYFMINHMDTFLSKLHTYFAKQPTQKKKIMNCLNELATVEDVTLETVKESIMPLLKGNPLLMDWFQQVFSSERPVDCHDADSEVIKSNLNDPITSTSEIYEELVLTDAVSQSADMPSCGIKYGQGGISYAGRLGVLPAKLTFMPYDAVSSTSTVVKESSCSHAVKAYVDAKLKPSPDVHSTTTHDNEQSQLDDDDNSTDDEQIKVVDEHVLKAHAIRLNPVVHSTKGETYADIADLLTTPPSNAEKYFSDDTKSPKKSATLTRTNKKANILSPKPSTSKAGGGLKSPPPPQPSTSTGGTTSVKRPSTSGVLAKAKRLKAMVESDSDIEASAKEKKGRTIPKVKKVQLEEVIEKPTPVPLKQEEEVQPTAVVVNWAREEDKIILEEERNGYETFPELLERLKKQLPSRSDSDIKSRYDFLMEILKKIQENS